MMPKMEPLVYLQEEWLEYKVVGYGDPAGFPVFTESQLQQAYEAGKAEKEGLVCGDCDGSGWLENRVEGRYPCTCMTEAEPYQLLEAQNLALMAACEAKDAALAYYTNRMVTPMYRVAEQALAIQPSADLLAERDRKRDAKLLQLAANFLDHTATDHRELAAARLDGSWVPELGDGS